MTIPWYVCFTKIFLMSYCITYTTIKIINYRVEKSKRKIHLVLVNIIISIIYTVLRNFYSNAFSYLIYYFLFFLYLMLLNIKLIKAMVIGLIAISLCLMSIIISTAINFIFMKLLDLPTNSYSILECISIGIIQFLLLYLFFKIRRFKDGFSFLKSDKLNRKSNVLGIIVSVVMVIACILYCIFNNNNLANLFILIFLLGIFSMSVWLRKSITKYYKEKMKDRTVEIQEEQLKEKDEIISNLKLELSNVLEINHKYNRRLSAMERAVANLGNKLSFNEEFANEYSDVLDSLQNLSKEYKQEFDNYYILPKTNIFSVDNLLEYMKIEALKNNIEFELEINCEISEMVQKYISKNKLETLLGDHITDAIIAINSSDSASRKIKVIMGKTKEFYQIRILDTGIEFEIETLLKLGLERTTTHRDSGGTGIGFMTTFETLKECNASLVIEEYNNEKDYKKSLNIIFDGKSEYNINSYRAEKIKLQNKNNRINIKKAI